MTDRSGSVRGLGPGWHCLHAAVPARSGGYRNAGFAGGDCRGREKGRNGSCSGARVTPMCEPVRQAMQTGGDGRLDISAVRGRAVRQDRRVIPLATEAAKFGGVYATHMRSEGDAVMEAIDQAVRIGREAHIPVEIWHIKAAGKANWGRMPQMVARIEQARGEGVDVTADTYAYTAWYNGMSAFIPPWAHDGGDKKLIERLKDPAMRARIRQDMLTPSSTWDNEWHEIPGPEAVLIGAVHNPALKPIHGKTLAAIAQERHNEAIDT